eukprot:11169628-Lingulodinium_polyedra.AAC.1
MEVVVATPARSTIMVMGVLTDQAGVPMEGVPVDPGPVGLFAPWPGGLRHGAHSCVAGVWRPMFGQ